MSKLHRIITGLMILSQYDPDMAAEHDIVYAGNDDVSEVDARMLESLGWFYDGEMSCWAVFT